MIAESSDHLQHSSRRFAVRDSVALSVQRRGYPRLAIACALTASSAIGLACSIGLHQFGLTIMWLRYPLALGASYFVFVGFLGMFVRRAARRLCDDRDQIHRDAIRLQFHRNDSELRDPRKFFDDLSDSLHEAGNHQADPRAIPLYLTLILSITVILVCAYFIWMAPVLVADVAVEGTLIGWLYRPRFRAPDSGWLTAVIEQTGAPAVLLALTFAATGFGFQLYAPRATTVSEVWQQLLQQRNLAGGRQVGRH